MLVIVAIALALGVAVVPAGAVRAQSMFSLHSLSVNPRQAQPGQPVNISVKVANTWGTQGIYTVVLMINGQQEEARVVTVEPLTTYPVNFLVTRDQPGRYAVTIQGLQDQDKFFTIVGAADSSTGSPVSAPLIVAVVIGIVLIASLVLLFLHRRGFV